MPAWIEIVDDHGHYWRLNQAGLALLTRQCVYNRLVRSRTRVIHIGSNPERAQLDTDFHGIVAQTQHEANRLLTMLEEQIQHDGAQALPALIELRHETSADVSYVRRLQREASNETWHNIEAAVHRGEVGVQVATQVRNLSVSTLILGSTVVTGGAAWGLLATGSALNGVAQWEDTGNVGSAVLTATGTFVTGMIPVLGAPGTVEITEAVTAPMLANQAARHGERVALIFIGAGVDANFTLANGLIQGSDAAPTLRAAAMRASLDVANGLVGLNLDRITMPVYVRLATDQILDTTARVVAVGQGAGGSDTAGPRGSMRGTSAPAAVRASGLSHARPVFSGPVCNANSTLSTGDCTAEQWVDQIVLHREEW